MSMQCFINKLSAVPYNANCLCCILQTILNGKRMTEAGPLDLISEDEEEEAGADIKLPGVHRGYMQTCSMLCRERIHMCMYIFSVLGDMSSRKTRPEIRVKSIQFSPTGSKILKTSSIDIP